MTVTRCDSGPPGRLSTGSDQLDAVLGGGIPRYSTVVLSGLPGTGKTILSHQAAFANAQAGRTCLYLSTLAEPPLKMLGFMRGFAFFQPDLVASTVCYADLGRALRTDGSAGVLAQLDRLVRAHRPELVVIDSFKCVRDCIRDPAALRAFTLDVVIQLTAWEVTALLVGAYKPQDVQQGAEFAIADGIIDLSDTVEAEKQKRFLRVLKMRGTSVLDGEHVFEIGAAGITVYPRLAPTMVGEPALGAGRAGSTIAGLRELLGGGLLPSTATLIRGAPGTGKTLVALSFLVDGARRGEPGLMVSWEESPAQVMRSAQAFGWNPEELRRDKRLDMLHVSLAEVTIERHAVEVMERAQEVGARRIVLDSLSALAAAAPNVAMYEHYLWTLTEHFKRRGLTIIMTIEAARAAQNSQLGMPVLSSIADTIIALRYVAWDGERKRAVAVLKMRGSDHDAGLHELLIDAPHLAVGPRLATVDLLGTPLPE
ncbi:MAG TPA: ATPase domain-containing protein [Chloroflexota bacterium]|nr:ATPase domain-containing protein [Chloroflexota bacterium]